MSFTCCAVALLCSRELARYVRRKELALLTSRRQSEQRAVKQSGEEGWPYHTFEASAKLPGPADQEEPLGIDAPSYYSSPPRTAGARKRHPNSAFRGQFASDRLARYIARDPTNPAITTSHGRGRRPRGRRPVVRSTVAFCGAGGERRAVTEALGEYVGPGRNRRPF